MTNSRQKFISLAESRTRKTIKTIQLVGNLSNKSNYTYSIDDVTKIFRRLEGELKLAKRRFQESRGVDRDVQFSLRDD